MTRLIGLAAMLCSITLAAAGLVLGAYTVSPPLEAKDVVVVYDDQPTHLSGLVDPQKNLWVTEDNLTKATHFKIKPEGICRDELCFPIPKATKAKYLMTQGGKKWLNLTAFAGLIHQPVAIDDKYSIWLFGERSSVHNNYLSSLVAPNFTLPDMNGKMHSLADFKGKKVLLLAWASW